MRKFPPVLLLTLCTLEVRPAWACSCVEDETNPIWEMASSETVFVGTVLEGPARAGCRSSANRGDVVYTVEVTEAFKGVTVGQVVEVATNPNGFECGAIVEVGESRLFYDLQISLCSPGGPVEEVQDEIAILRQP